MNVTADVAFTNNVNGWWFQCRLELRFTRCLLPFSVKGARILSKNQGNLTTVPYWMRAHYSKLKSYFRKATIIKSARARKHNGKFE